MRFDYKDTDKEIKISIYDLDFNINMNDKDVERIKNQEKKSDILESEIDNILGDGAVKRINAKRKSDGYKEMDLQIELTLMGCIFETYANAMSENVLGRVEKTFNNMNNRINGFNRPNYRRNNYRRY